jgi:hypothetical protein
MGTIQRRQGGVMSGYGLTSGSQANTCRPRTYTAEQRRARKAKKMKLTWKQRFRNWLHNDGDEVEKMSSPLGVEPASLESTGMRLQVYKASGGFVVETRRYDERTDRHQNTMHVITETEDLGERLGKIVMMEALRG